MRVKEPQLHIDFPIDEIRILLVQSGFSLSGTEPYRWEEPDRSAQLTKIDRCLQIAQQQPQAHFTVFPEYSLPGLDGVQMVQNAVLGAAWGTNSVVVAGVDGLDPLDYQAICGLPGMTVDSEIAADHVEGNEWVNCSITWVKERDGQVRSWVQPKLIPNWEEDDTSNKRMYKGSVVNVFRGLFTNKLPFRFMTLMCYDWVGRADDNTQLLNLLRNELNERWSSKEEIHWLFVLQCNKQPNHQTFLSQAHDVLTDPTTTPFVEFDKATLVFANVSSLQSPGRSAVYGYSSLVLPPQAPFLIKACRPTFSSEPKKLRQSEALGMCTDVVFREMGPCVYDLITPVPAFVVRDPTQKSPPVRKAIVHALEGASDDPRLPGAEVPASTKWICDELDEIEPLSAGLAGIDLHDELQKQEEKVTTSLRLVSSERQEEMIRCGCADKADENVDLWSDAEIGALSHIHNVTSALGVIAEFDVGPGRLHGSVLLEDQWMEIAAVTGSSHDVCQNHFASGYLSAGNDFVLLVTRDRDNLDRATASRLCKSFTKVNEIDISNGPKITSPQDRVLHGCFRDYETFLIKSADESAFRGAAYDYIRGTS